jgi:anti-sigma B factor antagonist
MPAQPLRASVRRQSSVAIIELHGEVNDMSEEALNAAYDEAAGHNPAVILLNFRQVNYITSTGVALIVGLLGRSREAKRRLAACGLNEHYTEIFEITRLSDFISVFPDETGALNELLQLKTGTALP